ncbi:MAG: hypothetical protein AAGU74_08155 [Bacillota bacterium]
MRSAKGSDHFPYSSKLVCYIEVDKHGNVSQIDHSASAMFAAYHNAVDGRSKIYAVWPGNYRSDLFEIDDLNALADAFGVPRPDPHVHQLEWALSKIDDGKSLFAAVDIVFHCGCRLGFDNIKKFAMDMKEQKHWDVATSKGISGTGNRYTISVRRSSL